MTSKVGKEKIGYKGVKMKNEKYYSLTLEPDEPACVEYAIGKTFVPSLMSRRKFAYMLRYWLFYHITMQINRTICRTLH